MCGQNSCSTYYISPNLGGSAYQQIWGPSLISTMKLVAVTILVT
jgi:hypothetical protein